MALRDITQTTPHLAGRDQRNAGGGWRKCGVNWLRTGGPERRKALVRPTEGAMWRQFAADMRAATGDSAEGGALTLWRIVLFEEPHTHVTIG